MRNHHKILLSLLLPIFAASLLATRSFANTITEVQSAQQAAPQHEPTAKRRRQVVTKAAPARRKPKKSY